MKEFGLVGLGIVLGFGSAWLLGRAFNEGAKAQSNSETDNTALMRDLDAQIDRDLGMYGTRRYRAI